uniref:Uncharacterized protein n=1 Tax=Rhizophora mucronata TaxID=61149 RepID=A0A2P2J8R9_RHIMU
MQPDAQYLFCAKSLCGRYRQPKNTTKV